MNENAGVSQINIPGQPLVTDNTMNNITVIDNNNNPGSKL